MIDLSNLEEYTDAATYDLEHPRMGPEGPFYLEFARQASGSMLELGCGTGRLTIPFAREGIDMVGLDVMPQMLAQARAKAQGLPIRWVEADVRTFQLETQFELIFTVGDVFHHFLNRSDQEAMLTRVREHLAPKGQFVIDVWFLPPTSMLDVPEEEEWSANSHINEDGHKVTVSGIEHYDALQQIWHLTIYRRWSDADGKQITRRTKLAYRYIFPQEMEALLHYNGLRVLSRYGDWNRGPLTDERGCHIYVCTKR
jgi:SAM-dependent methyltransferase